MPSSDARHISGTAGEDEAVRYLTKHGYKILERNYRCAAGEIDIIARYRSAVVFVEVRRRKSAAFGDPAATVDRRKQSRIVRTARHYIACKFGKEPDCRFDVIALLDEAGGKMKLRHIKNAFGTDGI